MSVPEHLVRHPTRAAIDRLAEYFDLPNHPSMQDWEIEVADPARCAEFLSAYESLELNDDEKFTLMWMILESFDELETPLDANSDWQRALFHVESDIFIHIGTVWFWSALDATSEDEMMQITPYMREILGRHRSQYENPRIQ